MIRLPAPVAAGASGGMLASPNVTPWTFGAREPCPPRKRATPTSTAAATALPARSRCRTRLERALTGRGCGGASTASCSAAESSPQKSPSVCPGDTSRSAEGPNGTSSSSGPTQSPGKRKTTPPSIVRSRSPVSSRSCVPNPLSLPVRAVRGTRYYIGSSLPQLEKMTLG